MSAKQVLEYLADFKEGATCLKIAGDLELQVRAVEKCVIYLHAKGRLRVLSFGDALKDSVWGVPEKVTPPIFRAMEILETFQAAARAKQTQLQPE
jgi:hypothetical protein